MDKSIRISSESYDTLKKHVPETGTLKAAAARSIASLGGVWVLFAVLSEGADIDESLVEVYQNDGDAFRRSRELERSGVAEANITVTSRAILQRPDPLRPFGQRWKDATGWTQTDPS